MNEKTRKIIVFSTLPAAIIWAVFNLGGRENTTPPADSAVPTTIQPLTPTAGSIVTSAQLDDHEIARLSNADWGADPFRSKSQRPSPQVAHQTPSVGLRLNGILYNDENPVAIINGDLVKVGETVAGARVKQIDREKVVLDKDGTEKTLSISRG